MKPRYKIGDKVRHKYTKRVLTVQIVGTIFDQNVYWMEECAAFIDEIDLKKYSPSRTGTRDPKTGRFVSRKVFVGCDFGNHSKDASAYFWLSSAEKERKEDSKQRNYQKILTKLDELEKKIDELGRRV